MSFDSASEIPSAERDLLDTSHTARFRDPYPLSCLAMRFLYIYHRSRAQSHYSGFLAVLLGSGVRGDLV